MVINMYKDGMIIELISKYSKLSLEEINRIIENIIVWLILNKSCKLYCYYDNKKVQLN